MMIDFKCDKCGHVLERDIKDIRPTECCGEKMRRLFSANIQPKVKRKRK